MPYSKSAPTRLTRWIARLPLAPSRPALGYAAAVALAALATAMRHWLDGALPPGFPFLTYFPALVITAFVFGWRAGVLSAVLGFVLSWYLFIPPINSFTLTTGSVYALALYVFVASVDLVLIWLAQAANTALSIERRRSDALAENRELLFRELQHRVGNNLQMVAAMLALQKRGLSGDAATAIDQAARRIQMIGATQRDLYRHDGSAILLGELVERVCQDAIKANGRDDVDLVVRRGADGAVDPNEAIPATVILAETIGNAIEHGLHGKAGTITVTSEVADGRAVIAVADSGGALPADFRLEGASSLGLRLANALARQLRGDYAIAAAQGQTVARLSFPLSA